MDKIPVFSSSFTANLSIPDQSEIFLSQSSIDARLQKRNLFKKSQKLNCEKHQLYSTSPNKIDANKLSQKIDFSKRSSVCDLKKSIYPKSESIFNYLDKDASKLNFLKRTSNQVLNDKTNHSLNQLSTKNRYSLTSSIVQLNFIENVQNYKSTCKQLNTNLPEKKNWEKEDKVQILNFSNHHRIQIKQKKQLQSQNNKQDFNKQNKNNIIHTRYPSSYAHLHEDKRISKQKSQQKYAYSSPLKQIKIKNSEAKEQKSSSMNSIQRLDFSQSQVDIIVSSQQSINEDCQMTARFNCTQEQKQRCDKRIQTSLTSLGGSIKKKQEKKILLQQFSIGPCKGKGRYGKVYMAIEKKTGSIFALKQVQIESILKMMDQFILQIKLQMFLNHPYITKIYGCFIQNKKFYIIMQYMKEGNLYQLIKRKGCLSQQQTSNKMFQICQGLNYMHKYNIIHRDLKPENIILNFNICKICDFSWSTRYLERRQTNCGTLDYLSPQIIEGNTYTNSIDIWAIGVLIYQMLVGKPPFYNVSVKQTAKKIKQCKFTYPKQLSQKSKILIDSLLKKNPEQRKQMCEILNYQFFQEAHNQ